MKIKLTTLLFGLLLAVGWTSNAFAQSNDLFLPTAVHNKAYYDALEYTWVDANQVTHTSKATDVADDPYQIYELLRFVYGNPAFPGPTYGAYTSSFTVEDPISYDPIQGGWNIVSSTNSANRQITIAVTNGRRQQMWSTTYYPTYISSIQVKSGDNVITSWTYAQNGSKLPDFWETSNTLTYNQNNGLYYDNRQNGTITIPARVLSGYNDIEVVITARASNTSYRGSITVHNESWNIPNTTSWTPNTWSFTLPEETPFVQGTVTPPHENGYTALMVAVKNNATAASETSSDVSGGSNGSYYNTKLKYVNYFADRVAFVKLLTDGLRIGDEEEHTSGTVFNCAGTYNKFFIISKGQAREKSDYTKNNYNNWYTGEVFPFQTMYEQFSPTVTDKGSELKDFYTEMMDGRVLSIVHDCASVIQESHQFSMSGNSGTQAYAMDGLNFFIPDFRLLYWNNPEFYFKNSAGEITDNTPYSIDGRDINPYLLGDENGKTGASIPGHSGSAWACWFGNYNPDFAPKIGIYKITLNADAKKAPGYDPENPKYEVTLNWVSSLNEMTGDMVPQTYKVYKVTYGADGSETRELLATVEDETSYTYQVPQGEDSYTITYIIEGYPTPKEGQQYPSFVAYSNLDDVVIPGLSDFLALALDHFESDFVIGSKLGDEKNYYRNFLHVTGDDDGEKALTRERILAGENEFKLYRLKVIPASTDETFVGTLTFGDRGDGKNVYYGFTYQPGQERLMYDLKANDGTTITDAYSHDKLGMSTNPLGNDLRIKGNGDIAIYPNGYSVNFKSIKVYNGGTNTTPVASWVVSDGALPTGWYISPGSRWIQDPGTDYYYLEGGGYIAIPDMLNNYDELTVVINGFGDAGTLSTLTVNDHKKTLDNAQGDDDENAKDYTWNVTSKYYKYVKVTDQSQLTAGEYLIVNDANSVAFDGSKDNLDAASNYVNVEIHSNEIASNALIENATFTIDPTAGTIKSASGYYIGGLETDRNGMQQSADNAFVNTITINQNTIGDVVYNAIITNNGKYLRYNPQANQNRFRYLKAENESPVHLYKKVEATAPTTTHSVRLIGLPIIDQFAVSVAQNDHPSRYGYILKYEPKANEQGEYPDPNTDAGKPKTSSRVEVPVLHTGSAVNGYYTEDTVKKDTERKLKVDVMAADMGMTLSNSESAIYYYTILASKNEMPQNNDSTYYVSNMQQNNFKYQEMYTKSDLHGQVYEAGEHHYFDSVPETGTYGSGYKTYVPYIKRRAIERFYYVEDSLHNTYGAPVWATAVGQVQNVSANVQPQQGWNTTWTDNGSCRLYMLDKVVADGYLPMNTKPDGSVLSNIGYEPYMFRIFVESPSNSLRHFKYVTDDNGNKVIAADDEGSTSGPWCVWSEYLTFDNEGNIQDNEDYGVTFKTTDEQGQQTGYIQFHKDKVERSAATEQNPNPAWDKDDENAIFGALTSIETGENQAISDNDIKIYVRFYYKSTGKAAESADRFMLRADNADPKMFYAVEKAGTTKQGPTAVEEILYHGEIVSNTYYNIQGMESDKPFDGVNIVITRYSDGTTSVSKVVK